MTNPIHNEIGTVFIPVSNIETAKDWYCKILGVPADGDILFGHLYIVPMQAGSGLVLDSKLFKQGSTHDAPMLHFNTNDIEGAYKYMQENDVELVTEIMHGHWFNFKDPDGNVLMVAKC